ncbi:MAG: hypothetical protein ACE5EB_07105 [Thermodesulfobacteriota bacterium]
MAKKIPFLLLLLLMTLTACAHRAERAPEVKKEKPLHRILSYRVKGSDKISHEDKWFKYTVLLTSVKKGRFSNTNALVAGCPVQSAAFTVYDRENEELIREETVTHKSCGRCHPR